MTQAITRLYGTETHASDAVKDLKKNGFLGDQISLVSGADGSGDGLVDAIEKGGVPNAHAAIYAERVQRGGSVVSVRPPFGTAQRATAILDSFEPIDAGVSNVPVGPAKVAGKTVTRTAGRSTDTVEMLPLKDDATPLSSRLNLPVLLDDPTPFSTYWKWPVLSDKSAPLSEKFGIPVASSNATPLSTWLNLPVFSASATPLSSWLNLPIFSASATPLSSWLNLPMFTTGSTPLSTWLGLQVISKDPPVALKAIEKAPVSETTAEPAPKKPAKKVVEQAPDAL